MGTALAAAQCGGRLATRLRSGGGGREESGGKGEKRSIEKEREGPGERGGRRAGGGRGGEAAGARISVSSSESLHFHLSVSLL